MNPRIRAVQPHLIQHEGSPYIVLRDPLGLAEGMFAIPQALAPLLELCDGTRDLCALRTGFELRTGIPLSDSTVDRIVSHLDKALLLDNERFTRACDAALDEFRTATYRIPALAGGGYPANPDELREMLGQYVGAVSEGIKPQNTLKASVRGLISPHIDFQRGGPIYAQVWNKAAESIADIELAIIFGTDHFGGRNLFTLTKQDYATPWGVLPTDGDIVERIADATSREIVFQDELHHKSEHSIELALVWLHYFLQNRSCQVVPILCGSFEGFMGADKSPGEDREIAAVLDVLQEASKSRRTLVVAAADLAHMGPAFGDHFPLDAIGRARIIAADDELIKAMCSADAEGFFAQIKQERDERRICGLAPIYLTLRVLGESKGESCGYAQCPADAVNASLVSICGVLLT